MSNARSPWSEPPAPGPEARDPQAGATHSVVGRYAIFDEIASGGMATVHLGRLMGAAGFSRTVAIKRLHPQLARDQEFATMFVDEARLASRINHPNVVQTLDVVPEGKEILLVMEYVHGVPFAQLLGTSRRASWRVPARIIAGVMVGTLEGLHAAHEARNELGQPMGVVHRDVSPQNVLIGADGTARVIDFGVAKAMGKMHATRDGQLKGKLAYMSPEQVRGVDVTRVSDVFSASIVLWEALVSERLFDGKNAAELLMQVLSAPIRPPRDKFPDLPEALEAVVMRGLNRDPAERFPSAREMAVALEAATDVAPPREIAEWVESMAGAVLAQRARLLETIERTVAAPPTSGERTRIEGLQARLPAPPSEAVDLFQLAPLGLPESGSGPRPMPVPILGAMRSEDRPGVGYDLTMPQKGQSERPPSTGPGRSERPASGGTVSPSSPRPARSAYDEPPAPEAAPRSAPPATPPPVESHAPASAALVPPEATTLPSAPDPGSSKSIPTRPRDLSRPHTRTPIRPVVNQDEADRTALLDKLQWPIRLVVAGVVVSLADFALRQLGLPLPIRPIWAAEVLVVVGVVWAFVSLFLPSREE
jgi:serine/threonine-protein kinase